MQCKKEKTIQYIHVTSLDGVDVVVEVLDKCGGHLLDHQCASLFTTITITLGLGLGHPCTLCCPLTVNNALGNLNLLDL